MPVQINRNDIVAAFKRIQDDICEALASFDGKGQFKEDTWDRPGGGGGRTRIIREGNVIEKGGVNFSEVHGECSPALQRQLETEATAFFATGVSIVLHPSNPMVPIIHMNIRYFELNDGVSWFGGGIDLTPHYVEVREARYFHAQMKAVCDAHACADYQRFKSWADDYFFIPHRNETRGIGGIFFDHLGKDDQDKSDCFEFTKAVGETFAPTYIHIAGQKKDKAFTEREKEWQLLRRGRYVEFNLVHDRGTRFGLVSNGRTESILMSLPAQANWEYQFEPEKESPEAETLKALIKGVDYIS